MTVAGYYSQKRTRSLRDNIAALFRTHRIAAGAIATGTVFPYRTGDVTFACEVSIDGAAPSGDLLILGTTQQLKITLSGADLSFTAGSAGADGITITAVGVLHNGKNHKIVASVRAKTGQARLWVDGRLVARGTSAGAGFPVSWASSVAGSYGTGLTQAAAVGRLSVYMKQVPRHFSESLYT